jgi:hypothetical protein
MFDLHEMHSDVKSTVTIEPGGMIVVRTNYLGAIRISETLPHNNTVHYYRCDKNAYPDDLAIGFKSVDEQHGFARKYAYGVRDRAEGFKNVWGYDVRMTIQTDTEKGGGFEIKFETRNLRSSVSVWNSRELSENWRWNDGLRARKNVYLSTEFEDNFDRERATIKKLKAWAEVEYDNQQRANQDRLQKDVEHLAAAS